MGRNRKEGDAKHRFLPRNEGARGEELLLAPFRFYGSNPRISCSQTIRSLGILGLLVAPPGKFAVSLFAKASETAHGTTGWIANFFVPQELHVQCVAHFVEG